MKEMPETTLFMLMSVDGKISTGDNDLMDFDRDLPKIKGVREGIRQYYELEKTTDLHSLNTGRVMEKLGVNKKKNPKKIPASFIIIDNKPHLTKEGVTFMAGWGKIMYLVTTNRKHPAFGLKNIKNMEIIHSEKLDLKALFIKLKKKYGIKRITIQSGGTMNSAFLREGFIDHISIVVAPCIIGGNNTSTLIDGESLHSIKELNNIKPLKLKNVEMLKNSYLHLKYDVM